MTKVLHSFSELSAARNQINGTLGLVPTMGALHEGHLSLVNKMRELADKVIVSIFVNPTQFGPNEDFSKYPRTLEADLAKLEGLADYVYAPSVEDIYPANHKKIHMTGDLVESLEGKFRPGHFDGVATVVNILFTQTKPDYAIFGEKDFQQLQVIKQLVEDENLAVKILSGETLREKDGLAMSSRNVYLSPQERKIAPLLHQTLASFSNQQSAISNLEAAGFTVQYLEPKWGRLLAAVYLGKTRLIDNIALDS